MEEYYSILNMISTYDGFLSLLFILMSEVCKRTNTVRISVSFTLRKYIIMVINILNLNILEDFVGVVWQYQLRFRSMMGQFAAWCRRSKL